MTADPTERPAEAPDRIATRGRSLLPIAGPPAIAVAALLLATSGGYGPHGDELYFRMLPPAWWYEDQPPLTVWLSWFAGRLSEQIWVQRVPAVIAAAAGTVVAALFPRLLGYGRAAQALAAWGHAFTVYPLLVGHIFLTSTFDLLAWQVVILLVIVATRRPAALAWAGVVAGLACWNKLLILVLVPALAVGVLLADRSLLKTRYAAYAVLGLVLLGGPQVAFQVFNGLPMSEVSADLIERQGERNRWLVLPVLFAFLGPPLAPVWWRGLRWRPTRHAPVPVLVPAAVALVAFTVAFPSQPYYPVAVFLPALAMGWGLLNGFPGFLGPDSSGARWARAGKVVAANGLVSVIVCLPLLPVSSPAFDLLARVNPVARDQVGWPGYVHQLEQSRGGHDVAVVTDSYALAGAVSFYGFTSGPAPVASGHNALWNLGPPPSDRVLLVGPIAVTHRHLFRQCEDAGHLRATESNPFRVAGSPMARCADPIGGWPVAWPHFYRLGG